MQPVCVFLGRDLLQNTVSVQVLRQGKLHNVAGAGGVVIELINLGLKLFLGDVCGQIHADRVNTDLGAVAVLGAHIGVGGGVVPHEYCSQTGGDAASFKRLNALSQLILNGRGGGFAVENLWHDEFLPRCYTPACRPVPWLFVPSRVTPGRAGCVCVLKDPTRRVAVAGSLRGLPVFASHVERVLFAQYAHALTQGRNIVLRQQH